jgi:hypothetical protein
MDSVFTAGCQGVGLALACGLLAGALSGALGASSRQALALLGALGGAVLFFLSLNGSDHTAWPGIPVGALVSLPAYAVASGVVAGASGRAEGGTSTIAGMVGVFALAVAGLALVIAPVSLVALAVVVALLVLRRRRESRKHEGLRVLR